MKIKINCPVCRQKLRIPATLVKLKITCPGCSTIFFYEIKLPNILKNISSFFSGVLKKPETKFSHSTVNYTDFNASKQVGKKFLIWILILIGLIIIVRFFKNQNDQKLISQYYQNQNSKNNFNNPNFEYNEDADNDQTQKHSI